MLERKKENCNKCELYWISVFAPLMNQSVAHALKCVYSSVSLQDMMSSFSNKPHYVIFNNFFLVFNNIAAICLMLLWELPHTKLMTDECSFQLRKALKWISIQYSSRYSLVIYYADIHLHFGVKAFLSKYFFLPKRHLTPCKQHKLCRGSRSDSEDIGLH